MSNQAENNQQQNLTPEEVRQQLAELEIDPQAITELSDEQLEEIAGGSRWSTAWKVAKYGAEGIGAAVTLGSIFGF